MREPLPERDDTDGEVEELAAEATPEVPLPAAAVPVPAEFLAQYPFTLDPFQLEAIGVLMAGRSVLVCAPTASGKTVVAEYAVWDAHRHRRRAFYTTPIKALSNQKFRDLRRLYGDDVGLLTGDVTYNATAPLLVMTTEVLRNMLMEQPEQVADVAYVVFDEIHYMADPERGTAWEESIILCPEHVLLVCLSATVANARELAAWLTRAHGPTSLVEHLERPVPLECLYYLEGRFWPLVDTEGHIVEPLVRAGGELRRPRPPDVPAQARPRSEPSPPDLVQALLHEGLLPAIYFLFGRRACEEAAQACEHLKLDVTPRAAARRKAALRSFLAALSPQDRELAQVRLLESLLERGVAFHHAGLLPPLKQLVEELFAQGLVPVVFATDTLSLGINMPARAVVIGQMTKYDGVSRRLLTSAEFRQLAGRAGRRGIDAAGTVVVPYSPWITSREAAAIAAGPLEPLVSAFEARYNSVLNLWDDQHPEQPRLAALFAASFAHFQRDLELQQAVEQVEKLRARLAATPTGCPSGILPLEEGEAALSRYVELRTDLRQARRELARQEYELKRLRQTEQAPPWPAPPAALVRRTLRRMSGGEPLFTSSHGWCLLIRRLAPHEVQIEGTHRGHDVLHLPRYLLLCGHRVVECDEEHLVAEVLALPPPDLRVTLPEALRALTAPVPDVRDVLESADWHQLVRDRSRLGLPISFVQKLARHRQEQARRLEARIAETEERVRELAAQVEELDRELREHPCHACPVRRQHERWQHRRQELEEEIAAAQREVRYLSRQREREARDTVRAFARVLQRFGYLQDGARTEKAALLQRIYDPAALLISELIWQGLLDPLEPAELAEVCSWFAYDREGPEPAWDVLPGHLYELQARIFDLLHQIERAEEEARLPLSPAPNFALAGVVLAWARGASFADAIAHLRSGRGAGAVSEGDVLLAINKTLDLMAQIRKALRALPDPFGRWLALAGNFDQADYLVRRDFVAQCLALSAGIEQAALNERRPVGPAQMS